MERYELVETLADILAEEFGLGNCDISPKFAGGKLILQPVDPSHQEKEIDIEVFFSKIMSLRNNLRVLEQKINTNSKLSDDEKVSLQAYVTKSYGSLTTFNVLFRDKSAHFVGASASRVKGGNNAPKKEGLLAMQKKLGLNEY